jgi:hypothetical protein
MLSSLHALTIATTRGSIASFATRSRPARLHLWIRSALEIGLRGAAVKSDANAGVEIGRSPTRKQG